MARCLRWPALAEGATQLAKVALTHTTLLALGSSQMLQQSSVLQGLSTLSGVNLTSLDHDAACAAETLEGLQAEVSPRSGAA